MIENYLSFDITRFVADCFEHKKALPSLRLQLADLDGIKAIDPTRDKVQSSPSNDGMVNLAMLRLKLSAQIEDYERDIEKLDKAMQVLTNEEREAIDICFNFNGESIQEKLKQDFLLAIYLQAVCHQKKLCGELLLKK